MASYRQVLVDGSLVGLQGLEEVFETLRIEGYSPQDEGLGSEIVHRLSKDNYIPRAARQSFAAALSREYAAYLHRGESSIPVRQNNHGTWRGYPREQIPWYPTIDEDLCNGCGLCLKLCHAGVLQPTGEGKVQVVEPFACIVGCSSCANVCKPGAIIFPPRTILDTYRAQFPKR